MPRIPPGEAIREKGKRKKETRNKRPLAECRVMSMNFYIEILSPPGGGGREEAAERTGGGGGEIKEEIRGRNDAALLRPRARARQFIRSSHPPSPPPALLPSVPDLPRRLISHSRFRLIQFEREGEREREREREREKGRERRHEPRRRSRRPH